MHSKVIQLRKKRFSNQRKSGDGGRGDLMLVVGVRMRMVVVVGMVVVVTMTWW